MHSGEGLEGLLEHMAEEISGDSQVCALQIPVGLGEKLARLHRSAKVLHLEYADDLVNIKAVLSKRLAAEYSQFITQR